MSSKPKNILFVAVIKESVTNEPFYFTKSGRIYYSDSRRYDYLGKWRWNGKKQQLETWEGGEPGIPSSWVKAFDSVQEAYKNHISSKVLDEVEESGFHCEDIV